MILRADGGRAVMLLERVRADRFHEAGPGELLWRMDLLYFTFDAGGWRIVPDTRRLVERQRFDPAAWRTFAIAYDPALSVVLDADGRAARVRIDLPATTDPATTRTGTMPLRADTPPVVIGQ